MEMQRDGERRLLPVACRRVRASVTQYEIMNAAF